VTISQTLRTKGFNASLSKRGVSLLLVPGNKTLSALVKPEIPSTMQFAVSNEEREMNSVHILRTALVGASAVYAVGSVFQDAAGGVKHRVTRIDDNRTNIAVVFYCETATAT
jgi:hypothetical protein